MAKRTRVLPYDCVIIGAGASGLACARALLDQGKRILILEGRARIGGRIFTTRDPGYSTPVELGAEFIHGAPDVTLERLESAGLTFYDLTDEHLQLKNHKLVKMDFFEKVQDVMGRADGNRKSDRSVDAFLKSQKALDKDVDRLARLYVEGFHAADVNLMGERALAQAEQGGEDLNGSEAFRVTEGYDRFVASFLHGVPSKENLVRLNTIVKRVKWTKGHVEIACVSAAGFDLPVIHARSVVVTVPLGVLKAPPGAKAALKFSPTPKGFEKMLSGLEMGHALRLNLRFRTRFWEHHRDGSKRKEPIGYLHAGAGVRFSDLVDSASPSHADSHGLARRTEGRTTRETLRRRARSDGARHALSAASTRRRIFAERT